MILTVDLASKFSAAMVSDNAGEVHREWDSRGMTHFQFARTLADAFRDFNIVIALIEDLPYGISSQAMTKPVTRFQGAIMLALEDYLDRVYFVNPSTWQSAYEGVARLPKGMKLSKTEAAKFRINAASVHAEKRGYLPPNLVQTFIDAQPEGTRILKKHTDPLVKNMTDYVDAFLMGDWVRHHAGDVTTLSGVQPAFI